MIGIPITISLLPVFIDSVDKHLGYLGIFNCNFWSHDCHAQQTDRSGTTRYSMCMIRLFVHSALHFNWRSNTKFFPSNKEAILTRHRPRFLTQLQMNDNLYDS